VATISGRYYAMDRDRRWERTAKAYEAIVEGVGVPVYDPLAAIQASYDAGVTDEFIVPVVLHDDAGKPVATIADGDAAIVFNFRSDRGRQLTQALAEPGFTGFERRIRPHKLLVVTMTEYEAGLPVTVAFPPHDVVNPLARIVSEAGKAQFHTAETEKYAHVTYFLNGGREEPFPGEDRELVPSPKVATYDLQPEMSALALTGGVLEAINSDRYDLVVINFANGDMVGHTGVFQAAVEAVETVDSCLARIVAATLARGGAVLVTADHGNADEMLIPGTDQVWTAHTKNPVPFILVTPESSDVRHATLRTAGRLADVAPTVLDLMDIPQPPEMTGQTLIVARKP
jgi:2,3-bisphosphoglycerate-independent phosphoglycerate mutase